MVTITNIWKNKKCSKPATSHVVTTIDRSWDKILSLSKALRCGSTSWTALQPFGRARLIPQCSFRTSIHSIHKHIIYIDSTHIVTYHYICLCFFKYPVDNCRKKTFFPPHQAAALVSQFLYRGKRYLLPSLIIAKPKVGGCGPPCDPSWSPPEVTELQCSPAWLFSPGRLAMTGRLSHRKIQQTVAQARLPLLMLEVGKQWCDLAPESEVLEKLFLLHACVYV